MHFCDGNLCITKSGLKISGSGAYFVFQREINAIPKIMELKPAIGLTTLLHVLYVSLFGT